MRKWWLAAVLALGVTACGVPQRSAAVFQANPPIAITDGGSSVSVDSCGPWSAAGSPISRKYGEIRNCLRVGDSWVITTLGTAGGRGVVAIDRCAAADTLCKIGASEHPIAAWAFYRVPYRGGVTLMGEGRPGVLIIDNGGHQITFDVRTAAFT